jgi:hypothetical protein
LSATVSLSAILETGDLPPRCFLTPHACNRILHDAAKHKRTLPELLKRALESVAHSHSSPVSDDVVAANRRQSRPRWLAATPEQHPIRGHAS